MTKQLFAKLAAVAMFVAASLLGAGVSYAQNRAISGTVVDASGAPVVGAAVVVVGNSSIGTVTEVDGTFRLNVPAGANINISCIGFADQTLPVGNQTVFNIVLQEDAEFLEETVVIGYGVQRKSDLTGSVASVGADDIKTLSTTDAAAALQGKAAGVQILSYSGAPGEGAAIRVRGYSSNSGNIGPLLIVDGLKVDNIQYLDPSMIQSIEILKDAASAAIYGAEAGNGVVLITTKTGQQGSGTISYSYKLTASSLAKKPGVMNAEQFIDFKKMQGYGIETELNVNAYDGTDTDWADALFEVGLAHQHALTFQGGNNRGHYLVALNYVNNNGMVVGDKDTYQRLSAQINGDYKIKDWLTIGTNNSIERWSRNSVSQMSETNSVMMAVIQNDPLTPIYYTDPSQMPQNMYLTYQGNCPEPGYENFGPELLVKTEDGSKWYAVSKYVDNDHGSPLIQLARRNGTSSGINVRGTAYANLMPFKGFTFTSRFGYRISYNNSHDFNSPYYANPMAKSNQYTISAGANTGLYYQWENFANYNVNFGKHAIGVMAGMSFIENRSDNVSGNASGPDILPSYEPNFRYLSNVNSNTDTSKGISNSPGRSANLSYFGRITYSYADRYSLQVNFRADAFDSSKLSPKNRWGLFPSFSAGWTISNESFIKNNISRDILSFLKLRASWSRNGNINVLNNYPYSTSISLGSAWYQYNVAPNAAPTYGSSPTGLANPNLTWETSEQVDVGLDARFFNNRLSLGVDWYNKNTKDLLVSIQPVIEIGVGSTTVNGGNVNNQGLEVELSWKDRVGDFGYSISGNFSTLKNKVTYLDPTITRIPYGSYYVSQFRTMFEQGYPIWYMYGYKVDSIDPNDGSYKIKDVSGDGITSTEDMTYIGKGIPDCTYGITITMDWKGFDLNIFGTGVAGNNIFPVLYRTDRPYNNTLEYYHANSWSPSNRNARFPNPELVKNDPQFWASDANVFDGSFFKIKQIQLGYTLPQKLTKKILISNLRIFASLDDFFTFTTYPGMDPETATTTNAQQMGVDLGSYPMAKKVIFGVNVTF